MAENVDSKHFLEYLNVIQSRKEIILAVAFTVTIVGLLVTLSMEKKYQAVTAITVRTVRADVRLNDRGEGSDPSYNPFFLRTQLKIVQSQLVLDQVIQNLNLQEKFARARKVARMTLADARRELTRSLEVNPELDTNIIEIRVARRLPRDTVRADVRDIANDVADVYRTVATEDERKRTTRGLDALLEEVAKYDKLVSEKEAEVERLRSDLKISTFYRGSTKTSGEAVEKMRLQQLESDRVEARNRMFDRQSRIEKLAQLDPDSLLYTLGYLLQDQTLRDLRRELTETKLKLTSLQEEFGPRHPDVVKTESLLGELNKEISEAINGAKLALQTEYEITKKNYEAIEADLKTEKESDIRRSGEQYLPFYKAEDDLAKLKDVRDTLKMRSIMFKTEMEIPQTPVTVIDWAEEPKENDYTSPNLPLNMLLSIIMGLGLGVGIAFFSEYVDTSVKSIEDVEQFIGLPVMGVIPQKVKPLIEAGESSPHLEAYRVLRTNMQLSKKIGNSKAICITSGGAGEGKSLTIANLAYVIAQQGSKVLVVDSDMRRPRQHRIFSVTRKPGLSDVLRGEASVENVIRKTTVPRLFVLPSGRSAVGSAGLLDSQRMRDIVDYLKGQYDVVLFDAPPVIGVSDASVLISKVDAVLMVIQHRSYPRAVCARAKRLVDDLGGNMLGVVLNNINISRDYYYYYHSYSGHYAYNKPRSTLLTESEPADEDEAEDEKNAGRKGRS